MPLRTVWTWLRSQRYHIHSSNKQGTRAGTALLARPEEDGGLGRGRGLAKVTRQAGAQGTDQHRHLPAPTYLLTSQGTQKLSACHPPLLATPPDSVRHRGQGPEPQPRPVTSALCIQAPHPVVHRPASGALLSLPALPTCARDIHAPAHTHTCTHTGGRDAAMLKTQSQNHRGHWAPQDPGTRGVWSDMGVVGPAGSADTSMTHLSSQQVDRWSQGLLTSEAPESTTSLEATWLGQPLPTQCSDICERKGASIDHFPSAGSAGTSP